MKPAAPEVKLVIDIETVPDTSLPQPEPTEKRPDPFGAPPAWKIVEIGVLSLVDWQAKRLSALSTEGGGERGMLERLIDGVQRTKDITLVTWNGRHFDLPVIAARAMHHGLSWPWYYSRKSVRKRYDNDGHWDINDDIADYGSADRSNLDLVAKSIGMPGKYSSAHGSKVAEMEAAGQHDLVSRYCLEDVLQTAAIMLRFALLRGDLSLDVYRAAAEKLLVSCDEGAPLAEMGKHIDRERFLLPVPALTLMTQEVA